MHKLRPALQLAACHQTRSNLLVESKAVAHQVKISNGMASFLFPFHAIFLAHSFCPRCKSNTGSPIQARPPLASHHHLLLPRFLAQLPTSKLWIAMGKTSEFTASVQWWYTPILGWRPLPMAYTELCRALSWWRMTLKRVYNFVQRMGNLMGPISGLRKDCALWLIRHPGISLKWEVDMMYHLLPTTGHRLFPW